MRAEIEQDARLKSPEITIRCPAIDEDILRIVVMLRVQEQKITGMWARAWISQAIAIWNTPISRRRRHGAMPATGHG